MKRARFGASGDSPFDLPLDSESPPVTRTGRAAQPELPLESSPPSEPVQSEPETVRKQEPGAGDPLFGRRLAGGALDLAAHLAIAAAAVLGSWWLGVPLERLSPYPLLLFVVSFSFVYHVLPLTFWGHTPGMASVGLLARSTDGGPLTIAQTIRRWLGVLLVVVSLGLLFFFRRNSRSLPDLLSGSCVRF